MANIKKSLVVTVYNEEKSIGILLDSIISQSILPNEIIIVDGGSIDGTIEKIRNYDSRFKKRNVDLRLYTKKGNISVGRNHAISKSSSGIIAITDAGCKLDKKWFENITKPLVDKKVDIIAGYYIGKPANNFQKSLVPYVLVMPERVNESNFLPSARSMAMRKNVWERLNGFSEKLNQAEDYEFSRRAKKKFSIKFEKKAVVSWIPRKNILSAFEMFYKYAYGDIKAGILRPRVVGIFTRYTIAILSILAVRFVSLVMPFYLGGFYLLIYILWSIYKNYKYVGNVSAIFYLPAIQFISDLAVISGSLFSLLNKMARSFVIFAVKEKWVFLVIMIFTILMFSIIKWGVPNNEHPFIYHMDEWHQLQSIRNLFMHFSPNMEGSANGPVFHFALSGIYVGVLSVFGIIDPFAINSSLDNIEAQSNLFVLLRFSTLLFSLGSVGLFIYILKKQLNISFLILPIVLLLFSPSWASFSNYFKYDIALLFWILLSILLIFRFSKVNNLKNYLLIGIPVALAVCTKISALPLFLIYIIAFFIYKQKPLLNLNYLFLGGAVFTLLFFILGIPDFFIGSGDYFEYFHSNLVRTPSETYNYILGAPYWIYLFTNQIPVLFGFSLVALFAFSSVYFLKGSWGLGLSSIFELRKNEIFVLSSLAIFGLSLIPLKLFIINRSLVVLPFAILFIAIIFQRFIDNNTGRKKLILFITSLLLMFQFVQGASWIFIKYSDPRAISSDWVLENIKNDSTIGIENVPIYQFLPDVVLKEYYLHERKMDVNTYYKYEIIDSESSILPEYIILSNADIDMNYLVESPKKSLLQRMNREGYRKINEFRLNRGANELFADRLDFFISLLSPTPNIYIYERN